MMSLLSSAVLLTCLLGSAVTQYQPQRRPLVCPPALPINVCDPTCSADSQCLGFYKCCPTSCGGTVCSRPVTAPVLAQLKYGTCPLNPTGPWVCSNRCTGDEDCPGRTKCCRNRCGALACTLPQTYSNGIGSYAY